MEEIVLKYPNGTMKRFGNEFKKCIGTGRLGLALRQDYLQALKKVQTEIGFEYIRGHGIFADDIGIYREYEWNDESNVLYNFTNLDKIFDSFLELKIKPFLELGFMPKDLASGKQTVFWWEGNVTPPKSYQLWCDLVENTLKHLIDRYGINEVLLWPIEIWNEPNLTNFWENANQEEYFKLYSCTVTTIKNIDERLQVGGPAICGGGEHWISDFIEYCKTNNIPVDFITRHAYSAQPPIIRPFAYYQKLVESDSLLRDFASVGKIMEECNFIKVPVHITEYNTSYNPMNYVHDTSYNAAYLAPVLSLGGEIVDSFSYWTFSDVFEEFNTGVSQFHGGFGLLGFHEIEKPTYHLFRFFNELIDGVEIYRNSESHVVFQENSESFIAVFWNISDEKTEKQVNLDQLNKEHYVVTYTVNEKVGNSFNAWRKMGSPRFPTKDQISLLQELSKPKVEIQLFDENKIIINLEKNEIKLVKILKKHHETQAYDGIDDSLIY